MKLRAFSNVFCIEVCQRRNWCDLSVTILRQISQLLVSASFRKIVLLLSALLVFGLILFLRKRDSTYTGHYSAAVHKKTPQTKNRPKPHQNPSPALESSQQESQQLSFPQQTQSKANRSLKDVLTMTEGFNKEEYLKNCTASSCRYESSLCPQLKAQVKHWHTAWNSL